VPARSDSRAVLCLRSEHVPRYGAIMRVVAWTVVPMLACVLAAGQRAAHAAPISDELGFQLEVAADGFTSCVLLPAQLQLPTACADLAGVADKVRAAIGSPEQPLLGMAVLRQPRQNVQLLLLGGAPAHGEALRREGLDDWVAGMAAGIGDGAGAPVTARLQPNGARFAQMTLGGSPAIRVELEVAQKPIDRMLVYRLFGARRAYALLVYTDSAHEAAMRALIEPMLAHATFAPLDAAERDTFSRPSDFEAGRRFGFRATRILALWILIGGGLTAAVVVSRLRRRRRPRE
jgi:hypothetical protein